MAKKPKVLATIKMPDWFVTESVATINKAIKDLGYTFELKGREEKDQDEFINFLKSKCSINDAVLLKKLANELAEVLWTQVRIAYPEIADANHLQADYKKRKIKSVEKDEDDTDGMSLIDMLKKLADQ